MYESAIYDWYLSSHWEAQLIHIPTFVFCYCNKTVTTFTTVKGFFPPNSCCKWFRPFQIWIDNQMYVTAVAYYQLSCMSLQVLGCGSTLPRLPWHDHTEHDALHMRNCIGPECKRMIAWHELFWTSDLFPRSDVWTAATVVKPVHVLRHLEMKARYTSINHDVHTASYCGPCQLGYGGL